MHELLMLDRIAGSHITVHNSSTTKEYSFSKNCVQTNMSHPQLHLKWKSACRLNNRIVVPIILKVV